ncbi:MAG: fluoride efflux transporter CrcB [Sphingomonadales bacterium]|nr:fluoride efflux transporter CrcB [Sphingomonadales bacterium]MDE2567480.1 fluoride efflux transporter CrcB [Sphingomonadales bacterium]
MAVPSPTIASLIVAVGGSIGAAARYNAGRFVGHLVGVNAAFPWPTLTVNVVGSLLMGLLTGWLARHGDPGETWRLLLGVGVLGGFTTFSSFSLELVLLVERGQPSLAAIYAAVSVAAGIAGLFLGLMVMRAAA